ncbi:cytochrome b561 [Glutamicibacter uratoxydans]|uniref:Cytochrome b561 n=1 Tax=Glutamicibacter uratoxydans TaxID=43667 RepID=A0A4Y4DPB4_GLUUR|nr:COX15/CtaA family protein [Glutamicibacter uratoxydans]GED06453.1 cytochrome b561 [Glutamicibacter uratoxydans]
MPTPFSWLASKFSTQLKTVQTASLISLLLAILVVVGGSVVRVTGSGLGCTEWPYCTPETLAPTAEMGIHGIIEFSNRLITVALCIGVGWLIIAARLNREHGRELTRLGWLQFWIVVLNAVIGGITVWVKLNPFVVAGHFIAASLLLTAATITWHKAMQIGQTPPAAPTGRQKSLGTAILVVTAVLLVIGTAATGSGPHAGDSADVPRMPFDWATVTVIHGLFAAACLGLGIWLWLDARRSTNHALAMKSLLLVIAVLGQGAIGIYQSLDGLPEVVVILHLFGAAIVWIGAIRTFLTSRAAAAQPAAPAAVAAG